MFELNRQKDNYLEFSSNFHFIYSDVVIFINYVDTILVKFSALVFVCVFLKTSNALQAGALA